MRPTLLRTISALAGLIAATAASAQTVVDPARMSSMLEYLEPHEGEQALRCEVVPFPPVLNFSFRFQAGYTARIPLRQYFGPGHKWVVAMRITPEGGPPVHLMSTVRLPDIPKTSQLAEIGGGYLVGSGHYNVQWMLLDDSGRVCRKSWRLDPKLARGERSVQVGMPPNTVGSFSLVGPAGAARNPDDAVPLRLTILLHAAPLSTRRTTLRAGDSVVLAGLLSSLLERLPARSVRLVVFNLDQRKELLRHDTFTPAAMDQVVQSMDDVQLGKVDYRILQDRRGHVDFIADLVNRELLAKEPSDVVLFLGPPSRYQDNVPQAAFEAADSDSPRFFYFEYRPYWRRASSFPDVIALALRKLRGKTLIIHSPGEFAKAIEQLERRTGPAR